MFSKENLEHPYFSPRPLCENTEWIAFPVLVICKNKGYSEALKQSKSIVNELVSISSKLETNNCKIEKIVDQEEYKKLKTTLSFTKSNSEYTSRVYKHIVIKFQGKVEMWNKMEKIAIFLDALTDVSEKYKANKQSYIELGQQYNIGK